MSDQIYLDFAAATPTDERVIAAMANFHDKFFGNPSSIHSFGQKASEALEQAKTTVGQFLDTSSDEIFFTSSGTESNNLAIIGVAKANKQQGKHIITTSIEHPSILNACRALEKDGWEITYLPVTKNGEVEPKSLQAALRNDTVLVSVHLANSEIGVIQDILALSTIARKRGVLFHTDACQAAAFMDLNVNHLSVDLLTFNGGKLYAPKGVAALYVKRGVNIFPILYGGGQQESLRSGTENIPGIVGLARACEIANDQRETDSKKVANLRKKLAMGIEREGVRINFNSSHRLPNHLSVTLLNTTETNLVAAFDYQGIALSSGSACSAKSMVDSHVLQAVGFSSDEIHKTVRISLGRSTTSQEIDSVIKAVARISAGK